jgi:uncharacterized RDD family membrane protein YckC
MNDRLDTVMAVETPEHAIFQLRLAGPVLRMVAKLLDALICGAAIVVLFLVLFAIATGAASDSGAGAGSLDSLVHAYYGTLFIAVFVWWWLYGFLSETWFGCTIGKRICKMRVTTLEGRGVSIVEAFMRNLLWPVDFMPFGYLLGLILMFFSKRFQRLGDLLAGTIVIVENREMALTIPRLRTPPTERELQFMPESVHLSFDVREAIEMYLLHYQSLSQGRQEELAMMIAPSLCRSLGVAFRAGASLYDPCISYPVRALELIYYVATRPEPGTEGPPSSAQPIAYFRRAG